MNYEFSVIIPTYNNIEYLKRALHSLELQTSKNFETIVIIDGSSDGTLEFLNKYKKNNINLKYLYTEPSGGPAKPRNLGINISSGKWICFLDADDEWDKKKIEYLNEVINKVDCDLIYHLEILKNETLTKVINKKIYKKDLYLNLLLNGNICSTSATVVKSNFIKKNNIMFLENKRFISVEDYGFWLDIARHDGKFFFSIKHWEYIILMKKV